MYAEPVTIRGNVDRLLGTILISQALNWMPYLNSRFWLYQAFQGKGIKNETTEHPARDTAVDTCDHRL
jgi:hypothetical protein